VEVHISVIPRDESGPLFLRFFTKKKTYFRESFVAVLWEREIIPWDDSIRRVFSGILTAPKCDFPPARLVVPYAVDNQKQNG